MVWGSITKPLTWIIIAMVLIKIKRTAPKIKLMQLTSFWHQFLHFLLTYSFTHHFFLL